MSTFTWLHLTDLHQGISDQEWLWPNLRAEFVKDLQTLLPTVGPIDAVFFTGDMTQSGKPGEYKALTATLADIWSELAKLGSQPKLVCVPGNHDLVRPPPIDPVAKAIRAWRSDSDIRDEFWRVSTSPYRKMVTDAFANYLDWAGSLQLPTAKVTTGILPGDFSTTFDTGVIRVGIVGLNSAFLQLGSGAAEGLLDVSPRQLHVACESDAPKWCESHDVCLLLTHHPPEWLYPDSRETFRQEIAVPGRFLGHLCGHLHDARSTSAAEGGSQARRLWQARSLFGLEHYQHDSTQRSRSHGYMVGRIEIDEDRSGVIRLWPREAKKGQAGHLRLVPDYTFDLIPRQQYSEERFSAGSNAATRPSQAIPLLVENRLTSEAARRRLSTVARWPLRPLSHHKAVRQYHQHQFIAATRTHRIVWLLSDWGLGSDEFVATALAQYAVQDVFRLNCDNVRSTDDLSRVCLEQLGLSFQELISYLAPADPSVLILTGLDADNVAKWGPAFEESVRASCDLAPSLMVVLGARRRSGDAAYPEVQLGVLDEPDVFRYVDAHVDAGPGALSRRAIEQIYARTEGVPMHIDRLLRELKNLSLEEVLEIEREVIDQADATEPLPPALRQAVSRLRSEANQDPNAKRSYRLLTVLTVLAQGETYEAIRRFDAAEPIHPAHIDRLRDLRLIEAIPLSSAMPHMASDANGRAETVSPKLLVVPRPVRDFVNAEFSESDKRVIVERAFDIYFDVRWREGRAVVPGIKELNQYSRRPLNVGNRSDVAIQMLRQTISESGANDISGRVLSAVMSYLRALKSADRYREVIRSGEECFRILERAGQGPDAGRVASLVGASFRMLGLREEAMSYLERAVELYPEASKEWKSEVQLSIALAQESEDPDGSRIAAQAVLSLAPGSGRALQAQALLADLDGVLSDAERRTKKAELEERARRRKHLIVANNLALELANSRADEGARIHYLRRVIDSEGDEYNRMRAAIELSEDAIGRKDLGSIGARERGIVIGAYGYLFCQRMGSLFNRCHEVLWQIKRAQNQTSFLYRMFRYSSFIWRIFGVQDREDRYLRQLEKELDVLELDPMEQSYFQIRLSAAGRESGKKES